MTKSTTAASSSASCRPAAQLLRALRVHPAVAARLRQCRNGDWGPEGPRFSARSPMCRWCTITLQQVGSFRCRGCDGALFIDPRRGTPAADDRRCGACRAAVADLRAYGPPEPRPDPVAENARLREELQGARRQAGDAHQQLEGAKCQLEGARCQLEDKDFQLREARRQLEDKDFRLRAAQRRLDCVQFEEGGRQRQLDETRRRLEETRRLTEELWLEVLQNGNTLASGVPPQ